MKYSLITHNYPRQQLRPLQLVHCTFTGWGGGGGGFKYCCSETFWKLPLQQLPVTSVNTTRESSLHCVTARSPLVRQLHKFVSASPLKEDNAQR